MRSLKPILLVEDDQIDAMTVERAFNDLNVPNKLKLVTNGEEALNYLRDNNNEKPSIILLDLNMPKLNGLEFLEIAKEDRKLKTIPVIVLTTSNDENDKLISFRLGIAGYILKPIDYQEFVNVIRVIDNYWTLSEHPEEE